MGPIDLDYNATTPLDPTVFEAMAPYLGPQYGNPSSVHQLGRSARAALDDARERLAAVLDCRSGDVTFTSGGTESCNLAVLGVARQAIPEGRHLVVSAIEHAAVLAPARHLASHCGFELTVVPVDGSGFVDPAAVRQAIRPRTCLVSVMAANNEVGSLQPVSDIGRVCRERGVLFHCDASQWFGKLPLDSVWRFEADLVSLCAHKLHGPKGAGALIVRPGVRLESLTFGGSQEAERRPGTENIAALVGFAAAAARFIPQPLSASTACAVLTQRLASGLAGIDGVRVWSPPDRVLGNTVAISVDGCDSMTLLAGLDLEGICASSGSACSVGSLQPSHVLLAMGASPREASSLLRFSLGRSTSPSDIDRTLAATTAVINRVRNA